MFTLPANQVMKADTIFYTLNLDTAQNLHSAIYIPDAPRLACVIADKHDHIQWNTFGLSDFMRLNSKEL